MEKNLYGRSNERSKSIFYGYSKQPKRLEWMVNTLRSIIFLFCSLVLLLHGAAIRAAENLSANKEHDTSNSGDNATQPASKSDGYLVISLGSRRLIMNDMLYLKFRNISSRDSFDFLYRAKTCTENQPHDFTYGLTNASVYVMPLPPGRYEFFSFASKKQVIATNRFGPDGASFATATLGPREEFSVPFTIKTNSATYVGQFMHDVFYPKGAQPLRNPGFSYFVLSNQQSRDLAIAGKRGDISSDLSVINATPDLIAVNSSLIRGAFVTSTDVSK
jgi:hypothetical protein